MKHEQLDHAIDRVAQRLTHVDDSPEFAQRIVAALPERTTWFGWLTQSWVPRLAMVVVIAGAAVWLVHRGPAATHSTLGPVTSIAQPEVTPNPVVVAGVEPEPRTLGTVGTKPLEPLEPTEPTEPTEPLEPRPDFERSLVALDVESLTPVDLPAGRSIDFAPLALPDLPLTSETFPNVDER